MKRWLRAQVDHPAFTLSALLCAWLLKWHYSHATAAELRWILAPTTWLTARLVPHDFVFSAGEGYLSRDQSLLIAPACAGINFLVVALLSLSLGFSRYFVTRGARARWFVSSVGIAYLATLLVNASRIALSVAVAHGAEHATGLSFSSVHRMIGIAVYLVGLAALCAATERGLSYREHHGPGGRWRSYGWALGCYVGITLVVPLVNGASHNAAYWAHAAFVATPVAVLVALVGVIRGAVNGTAPTIAHMMARHATRSLHAVLEHHEAPVDTARQLMGWVAQWRTPHGRPNSAGSNGQIRFGRSDVERTVRPGQFDVGSRRLKGDATRNHLVSSGELDTERKHRRRERLARLVNGWDANGGRDLELRTHGFHSAAHVRPVFAVDRQLPYP